MDPTDSQSQSIIPTNQQKPSAEEMHHPNGQGAEQNLSASEQVQQRETDQKQAPRDQAEELSKDDPHPRTILVANVVQINDENATQPCILFPVPKRATKPPPVSGDTFDKEYLCKALERSKTCSSVVQKKNRAEI